MNTENIVLFICNNGVQKMRVVGNGYDNEVTTYRNADLLITGNNCTIREMDGEPINSFPLIDTIITYRNWDL